jgi:hypothetical protein
MTVPMNDLCQELMAALETFDRTTAPLGLYACEEYRAKDKPFPRLHQEWQLALKPRLKQLGCRPGWANAHSGDFGFALPDRTHIQMGMASISKIKVRKFGSAYRVDPQRDYPERWNQLRLDRTLSKLWKPSAFADPWRGLDLFLLIAFAEEPEPVEKELAQLREQLQWEENGVAYYSRSWADRYGRHFYVRLCGWTLLPEAKREQSAAG